jgi:hypothetical protein
MEVTWLTGLDRAVFWPTCALACRSRRFHAMPAQTAVQPRARPPARDVPVQEFPNHGQQVIQRDRKRPAQRHSNRFLHRRLRRLRRLEPVRRMAGICNAVTLAPFRYRLRCHPKAVGKNRPSRVAGLKGSPNLRSPLCSNQWRINGSPSWPACEDGSARPHPVPNVPQHRSCHEHLRSPRGNVSIWDGTGRPHSALGYRKPAPESWIPIGHMPTLHERSKIPALSYFTKNIFYNH